MLRGLTVSRERRFACTACGKCCVGQLPLTLDDALAHAALFPLAVVWTPLKPGHKAFDITSRLGLAVTTRDRKRLAVRLSLASYLPATLPCPALQGTLCAIQEHKPARCRAMPFFAWRDEADQDQLLVPRPGWVCDTSEAAPVVYRDKSILDRTDFDQEREAIEAQAPLLRDYGAWALKAVPTLVDQLAQAAAKPLGGHVALGFASLLRRLPDPYLANRDRAALAAAQIAVLRRTADQLAGQPALATHERSYRDWIWELERLAG